METRGFFAMGGGIQDDQGILHASQLRQVF
jgi:hypothetical protein